MLNENEKKIFCFDNKFIMFLFYLITQVSLTLRLNFCLITSKTTCLPFS